MNTRIEQIEKGFIEAMYFADGADASFKDEEGFYLDGVFNQDLELSEQAKDNVKELIQSVLKNITADDLLTLTNILTLDRIGNCIYYDVAGHGVGFSNEDLSSELCQRIEDITDDYFLEIYDVENNVQMSFWTKGA